MKENEKIDKCLNLARELNSLQRLGKKNAEIGNQNKNRDHWDHSIVKIG